MQTHANISAELTTEEEAAALALVSDLEGGLPFLVNMGPEERRVLAVAGDRSQAFVQKALDLARQAPEILPGDFDLAEFEKDVNLAKQLERISLAMTRVQERIRNTILAARADAYQQSLEVYHRAKRTRRAGLADLVRELGRRFRRATKAGGEAGNGTEAPA